MQHNPSFARFIRYVAYLFPCIGLFDAIENYILIQLLLGSQSTMWPEAAYYFATAKFSGAGVVLLLILIGQGYVKVKAT